MLRAGRVITASRLSMHDIQETLFDDMRNSSVLSLLMILQDYADHATQGDVCSSTLKSLNVPNGPCQQIHPASERRAS